MNPNIDAELQQLKAYLAQYPHEAVQLAVNHLEDYLILLNECQRLQDQIELFKQSRPSQVSLDLDPSNNTQLTLEQKFRVEILKRNLASQPNHNQAKFWAVEYFKFFLHLSESYLEKRVELISLKNQPSLPYFL
ncbi:MAG: hypothetical protein HC764_25405 [Pleurocapsa sp. CRU_1_2]|nr:hypothetical protein [Pleurocapsa sp. CRU_1_2]